MPKARKSKKKADAAEPSVSTRLKVLRETMGWPMAEVARRFGVTPSAVSKWESGEMSMSGPAMKLLEIFEARAQQFSADPSPRSR